SGVIWRTPEWTLQVLGAAQIAVGIWLIAGWAERFAVAIATLWMAVLIVLVAAGSPAMLTDPYGALVKDLCLIACAITVWMLAPMADEPRSLRNGYREAWGAHASRVLAIASRDRELLNRSPL